MAFVIRRFCGSVNGPCAMAGENDVEIIRTLFAARTSSLLRRSCEWVSRPSEVVRLSYDISDPPWSSGAVAHPAAVKLNAIGSAHLMPFALRIDVVAQALTQHRTE